MIAPDGHEQRASLSYAPRDVRHAGEVAGFVGALDHHVADIRHRNPDQVLAARLDVVPPSAPVASW